MNSIHSLLEQAINSNASDLLIAAGSRPTLRVDGRLVITDSKAYTREDAEEAIDAIIDSSIRDYLLEAGPSAIDTSPGDFAESKMKALRDREEMDLVFTIAGLARVRANLFLQRNTFGAALRIIPIRVQSIEELNLPDILKEWASQPQGLVIISGPTCSGKSTTVAAMIDHINTARECHVVTIEDPVEHVFEDRTSIIHQREIGGDTKSYASALKAVLRQTPDVIVIGEMRDAETLNVAITAAEVGHLVISTLHTTSASAAIDRILNNFPCDVRQQMAVQLSSSLIGVSSQRLLKKASGLGRLPALEIMIGSPTVKKLIEEMQLGGLPGAIKEGRHYGMVTINQYLEKLCQKKVVAFEEAVLKSPNPTELRQMLRRG